VPIAWCSGFLVEKERGLFGSAKHCAGVTGKWRIFFYGSVYDGVLVRVPPISDVVIIKIQGDISPNAPDPYPFVSEIKKGDKVFIRGIHPHNRSMQENKQVVAIIKDYYGMVIRERETSEEKEHVFDNLEARVTDIALEIKNREIEKMAPAEIAEIANTYLDLKTQEDHGASFSGLSGGPVVNDHGELIGVISSQKRLLRPEEVAKGIYILSIVWNTVRAVPAEEVKRTISQLVHLK
jgi:hypothetical protein